MKRFSALLAVLAFGLCGAIAAAQPAGEGKRPKEHGDPTQPHDCSKAPDEHKERCQARNKALEKCKGKEGDAHRQCMMAQRPKQGSQEPPAGGK